LILIFSDLERIKIKRSQPSAAPTPMRDVSVFKSIQRSEIKTKPFPPAFTASAPTALLVCIDFNTDEISRTSQNHLKPLI